MPEEKKKKIMYVDHDSTYKELVYDAFSSGQFECCLCNNGNEALARIPEIQPDIIVLEYELEDMSAEELYTSFLSNSHYGPERNVPFIALISNGQADKYRLYHLGFSACLAKPFRNRDLIEFVEDVLVSHQIKMEEVHFWETIRKSKDFLERVVESSADAILTTDKKGVITYCNRACEELLSYSFDDLIGMRVNSFLKENNNELLRISADLRKRKQIPNYKTCIINKHDEHINVNVSISIMKNGKGKIIGALGVCKESSGNRFSEYDTNESGRVAAIIETAVAVNHAINNPLVPILGNAQFLLQSDKVTDEDIRKRLRTIVNSALRIRDITQKLARITNPVKKEYLQGTMMLDIEAST